ncbi:MAG: tetratricopeptide repeat protein [Spirochaetota bacterium]
MSDKLADIIFIAVPDHLDREIGAFRIDPERMLPVEVTSGTDRYDIHDLAWEQIVSAMLKILAYKPDYADADYYRDFILAVTPEIIAELTETAIIKTRNGDLELAEEIFLALRGLQPGDQRSLVNLALLYEQRAEAESRVGNEAQAEEYIEEAFTVYQELFSFDETLPEAHLNAGFFFVKQKSYEQGKRHLEVYVARGDDEEHKQEARDIIEQIESQSLSDTLFKEAYDFIQMGKEKEGIDKITRFIETHPDVWNAWFILGWGHRRMRAFERAKEAFERSLELGPRQPDTLNELAICHLELDDVLGARALLTEALTAEPENTKIISNMGILALKEGDPKEAAGYFRTVLELDPDDRVAQAYLDQIADE